MSDPRELRNLLGHFATGVAVVTAETGDGERAGVTINSFSSVSLDPKLVLFSLDRSLASLPVFERADRYGINFLAADQQTVSSRFASRGYDKWSETTLLEGREGAPLLDGALAHIECERHQLVEAGDHVLFLCRVIDHSIGASKDPLVFFKGRYCFLESVAAASSSLPS